MEKIKSNLVYIVCTAIGFLNFILLVIPYVANYYSYNNLVTGGKGSNSNGINGYEIMRLWNAGAGGVLSALFQIFVLIVGILLVVYGICGLLKAIGLFEAFPDRVGKLNTKTLGEYALYAYAGLNFLLLIFLIVLCATNSFRYEEQFYTEAWGLRFSAGIFVTLFFAAGAIVALKLLQKKFPQSENTVVKKYICSVCGKKMKSKDKFCSQCGGAVTEIIEGNESEKPHDEGEEQAEPRDDVVQNTEKDVESEG